MTAIVEEARITSQKEVLPSSKGSLTKKKKIVLSYEVFWKYIDYEEGSKTADVSGIFSQQCFDEWLSTRPNKKIKYPAQSYQRVLYAHIRGADKRRHFPEPVEEELLKLLRDVDNNPWTELFKDSKVKVGKRGFLSKGYNEVSKMIEEKKKALKSLDECSHDILGEDLTFNEPQTVSMIKKRPISPPTPDPLDLTGSIRYSLQFPAPSNKTAPWDMLQQVLQSYVPAETRKASIVSAKNRGINLWSPAIYYYLNEMIDSTDIRFSNGFLYPKLHEQVFRKDELIGTFVSDPNNIVSHENDNVAVMFKGSLLDKHLYELYASLLSLYFSYINDLPKIYDLGLTWRRAILQRNDGSRMICLMKSVKVNDRYIFSVQDQSHLYPDSLGKPFFI